MFTPVITTNPTKVLSKIANKAEDLSKKVTLNDIIKIVDISKNIIKHFKKFCGTVITLTNNEIKDIMQVIKCLENFVKSLIKENFIKRDYYKNH